MALFTATGNAEDGAVRGNGIFYKYYNGAFQAKINAIVERGAFSSLALMERGAINFNVCTGMFSIFVPLIFLMVSPADMAMSAYWYIAIEVFQRAFPYLAVICDVVVAFIAGRTTSSPVSNVPQLYNLTEKRLGTFRGIEVHTELVRHCSRGLRITWLTPNALYFKYCDDNHQVWVYCDEIDSYIQLVLANVRWQWHSRVRFPAATACTDHPHLGMFKDANITSSTITHGYTEREVFWLNRHALCPLCPLSSSNNYEVWIYNPENDSYVHLQVVYNIAVEYGARSYPRVDTHR